MAEAKNVVKNTKSKAESNKKVADKKVAVKAADVESGILEVTDSETVIEAAAETVEEAPKVAVAKAGKHSAKALKEAEEKKAKEERKVSKDEVAEAQKSTQKPPRTKAERASKKYREAYKLIEANRSYSLPEALELATKTSTTKFDSSVELHIRLGVDPKQADQNIRGNVVLPAGSGKTVRIAVICEPEDEKAAASAGADIVGAEKIFAQLDKEKIDFDMLVAAPSQMAKLGKYAKTLGPRGLMPSPKAGTVNADVAKAVKEAKAGKVEYRVDSSGIIHLSVGKVSFGGAKLEQNASAVMGAVRAAKPASLKGNYILSVFVTTTMGPSIKVSL